MPASSSAWVAARHFEQAGLTQISMASPHQRPRGNGHPARCSGRFVGSRGRSDATSTAPRPVPGTWSTSLVRDEEAFVDFAQAVRPRLRRTAYLMCGDWDQASDHVQEGLIRVYVAWPRLTRSGREYAYARKAVVSACLDHARRRSSTEVPSEPGDVPSRHDLAESVALRSSLVTALDDLPPRQRACVVLRYFDDLSVA